MTIPASRYPDLAQERKGGAFQRRPSLTLPGPDNTGPIGERRSGTARGGRQVTRNRVEDDLKLGAQDLQGDNRGNGHQRGDQTVFDHGGAGFVFQKGFKKRHVGILLNQLI